MERIAAGLRQARGWRRIGCVLLLGGLGALAQPPLGGVPVLLLVAPGFLWLLEGTVSRRQAFALGWWFAFGHFVIGLYWISFALLVDIARFWWVMPLAVAGLPAGLALFWGLAAVGLRGLLACGNPWMRPLAFAVVWTATEWLRGHLFTGFPWLLAGYGWTGWLAVAQTAAVVGVYGLTFLTWLVAALPVLLDGAGHRPRLAWGAVAGGVGLFTLLAAAGAWHLAAHPVALRDADAGTGNRVRLVQPNISQQRKWAAGERDRNLLAHLELTHRPGTDSGKSGETRPQIIVWPETAVSFFLALDAGRRGAMAAAVPAGGMILSGVPRISVDSDGKRRFWNSLVALDGSGAVVESYDKFHLVPFGEYVPFRDFLANWFSLNTIAGGGADFSAGPGPRTLRLPGMPPFSPLICYEVIFPHAVVNNEDRPEWLLNITNDAWYGRSAGPYQHLAIAVMRAVEEGLPLVRVANTGISAIVDSQGRVLASIPLGSEGFLDAVLPVAASPTFYARLGDSPLGILLLVCGVVLAISWRRRHHQAANNIMRPAI